MAPEELERAPDAKDDKARSVLVVDDDQEILKQIRWALADDYRVSTASSRLEALEVFSAASVPIVLLDLGLPPHPRDATEGLLALRELLSREPRTRVIIVSGNSDRQNAIRAIELGAHDVFPKPVDLDQLKVVLDRTFRIVELEREARAGAAVDGAEGSLPDLIGKSEAMSSVVATVRKVAPTSVPVLITGDTGTGKELVASAIHALGSSSGGPFVAINCGAIPENLLESELFGHEKGAFTGAASRRKGRIEYAEGGTLFLDEIGDLDGTLQVKILRFLQERVIERVGGREWIPVSTRVVAATHVDLEDAVAAGRFREDLYFRLAVVKLRLPALRDREGDVLLLAEHFLERFSGELQRPSKRLSPRAEEAILGHPWTGNVRELQNRVRRAIVCSETASIEPEDLELSSSTSSARGPAQTLREARERVECELVKRALAENQGNISRTARVLGISRPTLYDLLSRYGLNEQRS